MYYHIKLYFLVLILSVICELQCSEVSGNNVKETNNQRDMMIQQFKIALINLMTVRDFSLYRRHFFSHVQVILRLMEYV